MEQYRCRWHGVAKAATEGIVFYTQGKVKLLPPGRNIVLHIHVVYHVFDREHGPGLAIIHPDHCTDG